MFMMKDQKYFDYAAATPVDPLVMKAMLPFFSDNFFNPSSIYLASRDVKNKLDDARSTVAHWLGARSSEIIFTAGATEANNLAIRGFMNQNRDFKVLISTIEHDSVIAPAELYNHEYIEVDGRGMVNIDDLSSKLDDSVCLVSVIYANNEIATVQKMRDISILLSQTRDDRRKRGVDTPLLFHTDASQAGNYLDLHVDKLGVDMLSINGGKIYGPKQSGALYVRAGIELEPQILGGKQESGLRSGTENVAFSVGLSVALDIAQKKRLEMSSNQRILADDLKKRISDQISDVEFLGHAKHSIPNILSIYIPGVDGERLVMMLDEVGIMTSTGSACSAGSEQSSHVLRAIGKTDDEAGSSLRISIGRHTTHQDIEYLASHLPQVVAEARLLS